MASIKVDIWGDFALFTRPEMKVERVSYNMITPSAARNILDAIMWHPGMKWVIRSIQICNPVRFISVRRNEITEIGSAKNIKESLHGKRSMSSLYISRKEVRTQRSSRLLRDVRYIIEADIELTNEAHEDDSLGKFYGMAARRIEKGQCFRNPYLGCKEFGCHFQPYDESEPIECPVELEGFVDMGYVLFDMDCSDAKNIHPLFFHAVLKDGKLRVPHPGSSEIIG